MAERRASLLRHAEPSWNHAARADRPWRLLTALLASLTALAVLAAPARAADPARWRATGLSRIPLAYFQGMASDPARGLWFDGVANGLYRTDAALREHAHRDIAI